MAHPLPVVNVFWITGASCDGCSISVLGDTSVVPIEDLLLGRVPGLPRLNLVHTVLALDEGQAFMDQLRRAAEGELDPYVLVVESSIPRRLPAGSFATLGEDEQSPIDVGRWVGSLAAGAQAVIAIGDCAVFGGPHSEGASPTDARGVESVVGLAFRSRAGLPLIHIPGCSVPPVVIATIAALLRHLQGEGPPPALDLLGRPVFAFGP